ncbi:thioredoxin (plasmid) [Bacillus wiedmannii]|nr:thioredoxin [Bacillus wiedmannii]
MKKILVFSGIIILCLTAIFFLTNKEKPNEVTKTNETNETNETNYYTNSISIGDLQRNIKDKKDQTIYFYQTNCKHCKKASPIIVPLAEKMNIDMKVIDLQKYPSLWDEFKIEGTPTVVHFKNGEEISRVSGGFHKR